MIYKIDGQREWAGQGRGFYPLYVHRYKRSSRGKGEEPKAESALS